MTQNTDDGSPSLTRRELMCMPQKSLVESPHTLSTTCTTGKISQKSMTKPGNEDVGRQRHYEQYDIQPIDFIVQVAGPEWCAGNIIKYAARYKEKNGVEDVKKAATYCQFLINMLEGRGPRDDGAATSTTTETES